MDNIYNAQTSIEYNKEYHLILNQIYDILANFKKKIKCKVSAHMGIKENKEADKAAKEARGMLRVATTRLP